MPAPRAVLIGPPGSGKSSAAAALARLWGVEARDTDADIVDVAGRDIPAIFVDSGEDEFRRLERQAVALALREHSGVLALGGGAILDPDTQDDLRKYAAEGGVVAYLEVSAGEAARRVGLNAARPLLAGSPRQRWAVLMDQRRAIYEDLATVRVATDDASPARVAERIAQMADAP